jgi:ATP-dependent helicase/nuclease subunit A
MPGLPVDEEDWQEHPIWGAQAVIGTLPAPAQWRAEAVELGLVGKPGWLERARARSAPAAPLAPSSLGEEAGAEPPSDDARAAAARRGTLIHALNACPPCRRREAAAAWLARQAATSPEAREALIEAALKVLDDPLCADLFGPDALAEVPPPPPWRGGGGRHIDRPAGGAGPFAPDRLQDRAPPARNAGAGAGGDFAPDGRLCAGAGGRLSRLAAWRPRFSTQVPRLIALPESVLAPTRPACCRRSKHWRCNPVARAPQSHLGANTLLR